QGVHDTLSLFQQVGALITPCGRHTVHEAVEVVPWEVGSAVEGCTVGCGEHRHGPATLPGHGLGGLHVDRVDVGAFLTVHLDVDEQGVHPFGGPEVLEGLARHHMAPVAGGVADGD